MTGYEVWFATPAGARFALVDNFERLAWARRANTLGAFSIRWMANRFDRTWFGLNNRVEIWRQPQGGRMYLAFLGFMRHLEQGQEGSNAYVVVGGPDANDLLNTRIVDALAGGSGADKTGVADDVMKEYVTENLGASAAAGRDLTGDGFSVQKDLSLGPAVVVEAAHRNLLRVCQEIADAAYQVGVPVYFAVETPTPTTFEFRTYIDQPGQDRTGLLFNAVVMTPEQERLANPVLRQDWTAEVTHVYAGGQGTGNERTVVQLINEAQRNRYRFNRREALFDGRSNSDPDALAHDGCMWLRTQGERRVFQAEAIDRPGNRLGLDWDFGDRVTATYGAEQFPALLSAIGVEYDGSGERVEARIEHITDPAVHCTKMPNLIAGTASAGCYVAYVVRDSVDNPSWTAVNGGLSGTDLNIEHLSISNPHGNRAYVVTGNTTRDGGNVWRNDEVRDGGSWTHLTLPAPGGYSWSDSNLYAVAVCACPEYPDVVHVLVNYHPCNVLTARLWIYRSTDGGDTWYHWQWNGNGGCGRNINVLSSDSDTAHLAAAVVGFVRLRTLSNVRTGTPPGDAVLYSGAIAVVWVLSSPTLTTYYWQYGQGGACRGTTCMIAGDVTDYVPGVGGLVVESEVRARAVTHRTIGAASGYFQGTDDGENRAFKRVAPDLCSSVYGINGWYFIGSTSNGQAANNWHTVWVSNDDGATGAGSWSGASGADPGTPGPNSIPWNCGGVHHLALWHTRSVGGSTPGLVPL